MFQKNKQGSTVYKFFEKNPVAKPLNDQDKGRDQIPEADARIQQQTQNASPNTQKDERTTGESTGGSGKV